MHPNNFSDQRGEELVGIGVTYMVQEYDGPTTFIWIITLKY
jgi:hypothetical protein